MGEPFGNRIRCYPTSSDHPLCWVPMETSCSRCSQDGPSWSLKSVNLDIFRKAPKVQESSGKTISTLQYHPYSEGGDHTLWGKGLQRVSDELIAHALSLAFSLRGGNVRNGTKIKLPV